MSPIEDYLRECLKLVFYFWDRAEADRRRFGGDRWLKALRLSEGYSQDSDFLLHVIGAR